MKKISIVIPAFNEENNLSVIHEKIKNVFSEISQYDYEIIFVNDGSIDGTQKQLEHLASQFPEIKYLEFSRNFGHQPAVKAGMDFADGDAVISMDCDMQHPPELIKKLIQKWEEGYEIVYTIRTYSENISYGKKVTSNLFYEFISKVSDIEIEKGAGADFRLLDASVIRIIRNLNESDTFLRGLVKWVGFKQIGVSFDAADRHSGESKYNLKKMMRFALSGVTAFSVKPLYLAAFLGFLFSGLSLLYIPYVIHSFITGTEISGWASLIMTVVFFGGVQLIILGVIGIYIGKIFKEAKNRPNYIIRSKNF